MKSSQRKNCSGSFHTACSSRSVYLLSWMPSLGLLLRFDLIAASSMKDRGPWALLLWWRAVWKTGGTRTCPKLSHLAIFQVDICVEWPIKRIAICFIYNSVLHNTAALPLVTHKDSNENDRLKLNHGLWNAHTCRLCKLNLHQKLRPHLKRDFMLVFISLAPGPLWSSSCFSSKLSRLLASRFRWLLVRIDIHALSSSVWGVEAAIPANNDETYVPAHF